VATCASRTEIGERTAHERVPRIGSCRHGDDRELTGGRSWTGGPSRNARRGPRGRRSALARLPSRRRPGRQLHRWDGPCAGRRPSRRRRARSRSGGWRHSRRPRRALRPRARPAGAREGCHEFAIRSVGTSRLQVEQAAQRLGEPFAARRAGRVLDPHRRLVEELATVRRVTVSTISRASGPSASSRRPLALELGATNRLGPHPQRRHDRGRGPGRGRGPVALELLGQNSSDRRDLSAARRHLSLRKIAARPPRPAN